MTRNFVLSKADKKKENSCRQRNNHVTDLKNIKRHHFYKVMLESNGRERKRAFDQTKNNNHQHQKQQRKGRNETKSTLCFLLEEKKSTEKIKKF